MLLLRLLTVCLVFFAPMQAHPFDDLNDKNQGRHPKIIEISEGSKLKACYVKALSDLSERDTAFFLKIGDFDSKKKWFVNHSIKNQERFCSDIDLCKQQNVKGSAELLTASCLDLLE
jgi:hypothetical protein